jgi:hypothetical protein
MYYLDNTVETIIKTDENLYEISNSGKLGDAPYTTIMYGHKKNQDFNATLTYASYATMKNRHIMINDNSDIRNVLDTDNYTFEVVDSHNHIDLIDNNEKYLLPTNPLIFLSRQYKI